MAMRAWLAALLGSLAFLAGCSTFQRDWDAMGQTTSAPATVEGRWEGTWTSDANDHHGGLRCMITADETGGYQARYHATYGCCLSFEYAMPMAVQPAGEAWEFSADADLGWLAGGRYEYAGRIAGDAFTSSYECARDRGTFQMTRVP